jgi:hypothetical protein
MLILTSPPKKMTLPGFPSLAAFIASDKDKSTAIFRRFDRLAARNILYLQSELTELEAQLEAFDRADSNGTLGEKDAARNWQKFKERAKAASPERMDLVLDIRQTLKAYSTFLHKLFSKVPV